MSVSRRRLILIGAVLLAVVSGVLAWVVVTRDDEEDLGRLGEAVALAPDDSARLGWTDWAAVRDELGADLSASSPATDVQDFLNQGFDADLTTTSALVDSAPVLQERFGFSPATVDWELLAQSEAGALLLLGLPDSLDLDDLEDTLAEVGYLRPSSDDGVWMGGPDLLTTIGGTVTQELGYLTIDRDRRVLAASDAVPTLETRHDKERGDTDDSIAAVTRELDGALSASIYSGDYACSALAMTQADDPDRIRAAELIEDAGEITPLRSYAVAVLPTGDARVALGFETEDQARTNADTRSRLASGPAPGQGGAFPDRFALGRVEADGDIVTMQLEPTPGAYVMSDLASGPVLFATC